MSLGPHETPCISHGLCKKLAPCHGAQLHPVVRNLKRGVSWVLAGWSTGPRTPRRGLCLRGQEGAAHSLDLLPEWPAGPGLPRMCPENWLSLGQTRKLVTIPAFFVSFFPALETLGWWWEAFPSFFPKASEYSKEKVSPSWNSLTSHSKSVCMPHHHEHSILIFSCNLYQDTEVSLFWWYCNNKTITPLQASCHLRPFALAALSEIVSLLSNLHMVYVQTSTQCYLLRVVFHNHMSKSTCAHYSPYSYSASFVFIGLLSPVLYTSNYLLNRCLLH